jgi:hypothetical protein
MSGITFSGGFRTLMFGALTWLPVRCLYQLWNTLVHVESTHGAPYEPGGFEYVVWSTPDPRYFVEIIAVGAGLITILWLLSSGRVPGWKWLGVTVIAVLALSACWTIEEHRVMVTVIFNGAAGPGSDVLNPQTLAILLLCIEAAIIGGLVRSWRQKRLPSPRPSPVPAEAAAPGGPRRLHSALPAVLLTLTAILLAWGGARLFPARRPGAEFFSRGRIELRLREINKAGHPQAWAAAARDVAMARAEEGSDFQVAELWQEVIKIEEILFGSNSREVMFDVSNLAAFLMRAGRPAEAEPWLRRHLAYIGKLYDDPDSLVTDGNQRVIYARRKLAEALRGQEKLEEAKSLYEKVIAAMARNASDRPAKLSGDVEKHYRDLLTKMGETPEGIQRRMDALIAPIP